MRLHEKSAIFSLAGTVGIYDVIREHNPYPKYCLFPKLHDLSRSSNTILDIFIQLRRFSFLVDGDDATVALMNLLASRSSAIEVVPHLTINSYTSLFLSSLTRALRSCDNSRSLVSPGP